MSLLNYKTKPAKSGNTKNLVVFLHGYGADGADLLSLGDPLGEHLPNTMFAAPDAPERSTMNPLGYQWFPIPWIDGSSEEQAAAGLAESAMLLNDWLDVMMAEAGVGPENTVLVGFSQGTMISLQIAPRRAQALAGIVGFSGRLLTPDTLSAEVTSKPPVLLIHGDMDDVVPPSSLPEAANALAVNDFRVFTHVAKGTAHGISQDGIGVALQFMIQEAGLD